MLHDNGNKSDMPCEESCHSLVARDYEDKFLNEMVDKLVSTLDVKWGLERDLVRSLLKGSLKESIAGHGGLLHQYLHTQLDIIAERIKRDYNLDDELEVDYTHATHAKLVSITKALEEKLAGWKE